MKSPDGALAGLLPLPAVAKDVRVAAVPAAVATGRVVDTAGRPVSRARVYASLDLGGVTWTSYGPSAASGVGPTFSRTDADGRFRIDGLLPGARCEVRGVADDGHEAAAHRTLKTFTISAPGPIDLGDFALPAPKEPAKAVAPKAAEATPGPVVRGTVVDEAGRRWSGRRWRCS